VDNILIRPSDMPVGLYAMTIQSSFN